MRKTNKALLAAAVAGLLNAMSTGFVSAADKANDAPKDVECMGVNACKGKSSCHTATHSCGGANACKGKGWVKVSKEVCDQLGGTVQGEPKKKS